MVQKELNDFEAADVWIREQVIIHEWDMTIFISFIFNW